MDEDLAELLKILVFLGIIAAIVLILRSMDVNLLENIVNDLL